MGRVVAEFGDDNIRELVVRGYRILHVISGDICYVSAVIHGSRDLQVFLDPERLKTP